jgi:hypothetical protein
MVDGRMLWLKRNRLSGSWRSLSATSRCQVASLHRDTFRRRGLLGGQGNGQDGEGQQPTGKTGEWFKVACGCQPPRSFWIRAKQYTPGPITCGICGQNFNP